MKRRKLRHQDCLLTAFHREFYSVHHLEIRQILQHHNKITALRVKILKLTDIGVRSHPVELIWQNFKLSSRGWINHIQLSISESNSTFYASQKNCQVGRAPDSLEEIKRVMCVHYVERDEELLPHKLNFLSFVLCLYFFYFLLHSTFDYIFMCCCSFS